MFCWIIEYISFKDVSMGIMNEDFKPVGWRLYKNRYLNIPFINLSIRINSDKNEYRYGSILPIYYGNRSGQMSVDINQNRYDRYIVDKRDHDIKKLLPPEKEDIKIFNIKIGEKTIKYI